MEDDRSRQLRQSLSLSHAVLYGLGVTIGTGIYVLAGIAAGRSGMHAPLAFIMSAVAMGFTAATFAELGTRFPVSASEAAYVDAAFHRRSFSLAIGLLVVLTACVSAATISVGSAGYLGVFFDLPGWMIIAGVIATMAFVSCLSTLQSVTFAAVMTVVEVSGLLLVIGAGAFQGKELVIRLPELLPSPTDLAAMTGIASTALLAVFAFIGFEHLVNVVEEMKDARRTLPRALFMTLGLTALFYALVVWVSVVAVPPPELAQSNAPLALVFERLTGLPRQSLGLIAVVATLNGVIVHMIMIGRVIYGLSNRGDLPKVLSTVNQRTGTPLIATLVGVVIIFAFAFVLPLTALAEVTSRLTLAIFAAVNAALIKVKMSESTVPANVFSCPAWVPWAGLLTNLAILLLDLASR